MFEKSKITHSIRGAPEQLLLTPRRDTPGVPGGGLPPAD